MYEEGTCKLWHRQGTSTLRQIDIARTEIRRDVQQSNGRSDFGVTIVSTTPTGHEIKDPLWIPAKGFNSSPFLEHVDVIHQFQKNDPNVRFIVRFAPNANVHPQYSFTSREDCWDFMQAITEKTLCASIDVETVKSAATHASAVEAGTETLQIWEDRQNNRRTVKIFRNNLPWDSNALTIVLASLGFSPGTGPDKYEILPSSAMGSASLIPGEDLVIIANDQTQSFYDDYAAHQVRFADFVRGGGAILWEACDIGWANGSMALAGVVLPRHDFAGRIHSTRRRDRADRSDR